MDGFPDKEAERALSGPSGRLEGLVRAGAAPGSPVAIVSHPHPQMGGTMHNKVVHTLVRTFRDLGCHTVRFNFRGVGASAGAYDQGVGEVDDLLAVIAWARAAEPQAPLWLAGFSFGAYIAARAALSGEGPGAEAQRLVLVAPPVHHFPLDPQRALPCPVTLIQGEADEVVPPEDVAEWAGRLEPAPQQLWFAETGHFFHGQLTALKSRLTEALHDE